MSRGSACTTATPAPEHEPGRLLHLHEPVRAVDRTPASSSRRHRLVLLKYATQQSSITRPSTVTATSVVVRDRRRTQRPHHATTTATLTGDLRATATRWARARWPTARVTRLRERHAARQRRRLATAPAAAGSGVTGTRPHRHAVQRPDDARFDNFGGGTRRQPAPAATTRSCTRSAPARRSCRPRRCRQSPTTPSSRRSTPRTSSATANATCAWSWSTRTTRRANPRQNPRGAYYENLIITSRSSCRASARAAPTARCAARSSTAAPSPATARWRPTGTPASAGDDGRRRRQCGPDLGRQPDHLRRRGDLARTCRASGNERLPDRRSAPTRRPRSTASTCAAATRRASPATSTPSAAAPTGLPGGLITQGGAIFANAYARNLQITNNVVQNNGGAYGTIRIGTPDLPAPTPTTTTRTSSSPTTASSPTPAPTWPAASGCSPAPTTTRSRTTTSAATSRPSTAAA